MITFIMTFVIVVIIIFLIWKFLPETFSATLHLLNTFFVEIKQKIINHRYKVKVHDNKENDDYNI